MDTPLAASRRVKDNRFFQNRIEMGPPTTPPLPGQVAAGAKSLEDEDEIKTFLHEEGPVADGVRRVLVAVRTKRRELSNEWDVRAAVTNFVTQYQHAVPHADPEYVRGMKLALKVYLGSKEAA
ncbi:MAG: hypothetical protein QOD77_1293 [Thermoplasmata archaeon]|jgi:hypothetical protein|nr:hypothetical protein [Thermoplasmata archaeon]